MPTRTPVLILRKPQSTDTPTNTQVLTFNSANDNWEASTPSGSDTPWTENHDAATFNLDNLGLLTQHDPDTTAVYTMFADHTTPADGQVISQIDSDDDNSAGGVQDTYTQIRSVIQSPTDGAEEAELMLAVMDGGVLTDYITLNLAGDNTITLTKALTMGNNQLTMGTGIIEFLDANMTISRSTNDLRYDVVAGANHTFRVNNQQQWVVGQSTNSMQGNDLIDCGSITLDSTGSNLIIATSTGTKIGTGVTQLLAFWDATPVVQPGHIADATDAASAISQLNLLLADMAELGLQAAV